MELPLRIAVRPEDRHFLGLQMKYARFYERYSALAFLTFAKDILLASGARKISLINRLKDYVKLANDPELFKLHSRVSQIIRNSIETWETYDYGEGYLYQSYEPAGFSGLRMTTSRVEEMDLEDLLEKKKVIDIGCNSGFVACKVAKSVDKIIGFDINPNLIEIGKNVAEHEGFSNVELLSSDFSDFDSDREFDAVLSFANHSTYDGNLSETIEAYFAKIQKMLSPGGMLVFESHHPNYEGDGLTRVIEIIEGMFEVHTRRILQRGSFMDKRRTFIVAVKR